VLPCSNGGLDTTSMCTRTWTDSGKDVYRNKRHLHISGHHVGQESMTMGFTKVLAGTVFVEKK